MSAISGEYLASLFARLDEKPMHEIMREDERAAGHEVVVPGDRPWLPAADWDETVIVSIDGRRVRLIGIIAKRPGSGAFSRMVASISSSGLKPVVLCPTPEFRATLKRRGWKMQLIGSGFEQEEQWSPPKRPSPHSPLQDRDGEVKRAAPDEQHKESV